MTYDYIMLGVGIVLIVGTGLFVASEFALVNLDRADLEARRERGESRLSMTIGALKITSTHLSSAQLGITLTTLLTGYTMEPAISNLLRPVLAGWGLPAAVVSPLAVVVSRVLATLLSVIIVSSFTMTGMVATWSLLPLPSPRWLEPGLEQNET